MTEGGIPVNAADLPTDQVVLEESQVYPVTLDRVAVSLKLSKRDVLYCAAQTTVASGDYEGVPLGINYLPLPVGTHPNASKKEKIQAQNISAMFGRFCRCFGVKGIIPPVSLDDPESIQAFQDFISKFYGNQGKVMVKNQEFNGRDRSGISDFLI